MSKIMRSEIIDIARQKMKYGKEFVDKEEKEVKKSDSIDCSRIGDNTPIYRYVTVSTFLSMIECCTRFDADCVEGENWLSHISKWEDPFEGYAFRDESDAVENLNDRSNLHKMRNLYSNYFGQSWTLCSKESDLRWRAYCPNGDGVRIESTIKRLKTDILHGSVHSIPSACMFSRVFYFPREILKREIKNTRNKSNYGLEMLFVKSEEFSEEFEYRVIVDALLLRDALKKHKNGFRVENGFLKYNLKRGNESNTFNLFENILLDPRMSNMDIERLKSRILQTGLKCSVQRSMVYEW